MIKLIARAISSKLRSQRQNSPGQERICVETAIRPDESLQDLYDEFCQDFCHKPGVNFMAFLREQGVSKMIEWLRPDTEEPEPTAFIRLAVDATRRGYKLWEAPYVSIMHEGNEGTGGGPSPESCDALSVLAQILGMPIKCYYYEVVGGTLMVKEFQP